MAAFTANSMKEVVRRAMESRVDAAKDKAVKRFTEEFQKEVLAIAAETTLDFEEFINPMDMEHEIIVTLRVKK